MQVQHQELKLKQNYEKHTPLLGITTRIIYILNLNKL